MNMQNNKIAFNKRAALMMFWDAGYQTEELLLKANAMLETLTQPSAGYYYSDDIWALLRKNPSA